METTEQLAHETPRSGMSTERHMVVEVPEFPRAKVFDDSNEDY